MSDEVSPCSRNLFLEPRKSCSNVTWPEQVSIPHPQGGSLKLPQTVGGWGGASHLPESADDSLHQLSDSSSLQRQELSLARCPTGT